MDSNLLCPSCHEALRPKVLVCETCDIKVEGHFHLNEFATLDPDDLHFLRIFIHSEGRIRDMESALGLSYPTIRGKLSALKTKLIAGANKPGPVREPKTSPTQQILQRLEKGELTFDEAMEQIKKLRQEIK